MDPSIIETHISRDMILKSQRSTSLTSNLMGKIIYWICIDNLYVTRLGESLREEENVGGASINEDSRRVDQS